MVREGKNEVGEGELGDEEAEEDELQTKSGSQSTTRRGKGENDTTHSDLVAVAHPARRIKGCQVWSELMRQRTIDSPSPTSKTRRPNPRRIEPPFLVEPSLRSELLRIQILMPRRPSSEKEDSSSSGDGVLFAVGTEESRVDESWRANRRGWRKRAEVSTQERELRFG